MMLNQIKSTVKRKQIISIVASVIGANQNLSEVLSEGNDGGGLQIKNIADPTIAQDAVTLAYFNAHSSTGAVSSVFGRTGAVVAGAGDYDYSKISSGAFNGATQIGTNGLGNIQYDPTGTIWNAGSVGFWYGTPGTYTADYSYVQVSDKVAELGVRTQAVGKNAFITISGSGGVDPTVKVSGSTGFAGLQEAADYSANYTTASLIRKSYAIATFLALAGGFMTGNISFATGFGIDSAGVLNVGSVNATTVNLGTGSGNTNINIGTSGTNTIQIGNTNSTVNILGSVLYENVTNLQVSDKLITLNKGGAAGSATGTGIEFEENSAITGYIKTTGGRDGYLFRAPANSFDSSFLFAPSAARSFTFPDASGTVAVSASGNIALSATGNITFTGILPIANGGTNASTASITSFNNITGYTASGATGTTSTNLVFSASPAFTGTLTYGTLSYSDSDIAFSFQKSVNSYFQTIWQNTNSGATASTDLIISSDNGTATTHYLDLGKNSSGFTGSGSFNAAGYSYLTSTSDDLLIGTTTNNSIHFATNNATTDALTISGGSVINGSFGYTGSGSFTSGGGSTLINQDIITMTSTTGINVGDVITGTNIPSNSLVRKVISSTQIRISNYATATTGSGIIFTIYPLQKQFSLTPTFSGSTYNFASGYFTNANANSTGGAAVIINDATTGNYPLRIHSASANYIELVDGTNAGAGNKWQISSSVSASFNQLNITSNNFNSTRIFTFDDTGGFLLPGAAGSVKISAGSGTLGLYGGPDQSSNGGTNVTITPTSGSFAVNTNGDYIMAAIGSSSFSAIHGSGKTGSLYGLRELGVINMNSGATGNIYELDLAFTYTAIGSSSIIYGLLQRKNGALNGFGGGNTMPTATVQINGAGSNPTLKTVGAGTGTNYSIRSFQSDGTTEIFSLLDNGTTSITGNLKLLSAGNGIYIKQGTNATCGRATLSGGTVTVNTTKATSTCEIFVTDRGGTVTNLGTIYVSSVSSGTSFTVTSTNVLDASTFSWIIIEAA